MRRQLGPQLLAAIADPAITDIIVNEDGRVWFEAHGKGLFAAGFVLPESHRESLIGTVAAALGTVADADHPIVEGELPIERIRFEGLMPPVVRQPCFAMRKPAQVLYTLDDYVRDGIVTAAQAEIFRDAITPPQNIAIAGGTGSGKTTFARRADQRDGRAFRSKRALRDHRGHPRNPVPRAKIWCSCIPANTADLTRLVRATMRLRPTASLSAKCAAPKRWRC